MASKHTHTPTLARILSSKYFPFFVLAFFAAFSMFFFPLSRLLSVGQKWIMAAKTKGNMRKMAKTAESSWPRENWRGEGDVKLIEIELLTNADSSPCKHTHTHTQPTAILTRRPWRLIRGRGSGIFSSCPLIATPLGVLLHGSAALILFWFSPAKYYFQFIIIPAHLFGIKQCELAIICYQLMADGVCVCVLVWVCLYGGVLLLSPSK